MSLTTLAVVSFSLAKVIMRIAGADGWADAADDAAPVVVRLRRLIQRKSTKTLANELAGGLREWNPTLADNDRGAALEAVDQFLSELGSSVEVQDAVLGDNVWEWVLTNGGRRYQRSLGGEAGDYFLQVLRRCVDEIRHRVPVPGASPDSTVEMLTATAILSHRVEEFREFSEDALGRLLDDEPHRREALERTIAASVSYRRELALPPGQYVVRAAESTLLATVESSTLPWPQLVVGDAGAGKSTLLWALESDLERMGFDPILVSTAWLLAQPQRVDTLIGATHLLRQHATPVLLFDTVDLMLHQDSQRQTFLALMEQLWAAEVPAIYTTRPEERRLIQHPELRVVELKTYDDAELRLAADALVKRHCPDVGPDTVLGVIWDAVARGLPAADVCRNPLMLRMLFESAAPGAPEFAELDVTGLYDSYWERRVMRDARSEGAVSLRLNQQEDLSSVAEATAAALLVMGLPQERTRKVATVIALLEPQLDAAAIRELLARLRERSVLEIDVDGHLLAFFHQTMLEYAFARWWLTSRDPDVLANLVERTADGPGDLFVGAALEQVLILAAHDGVDTATRSACRALVESRSGSIQAIGLAAWAHRASTLRPAAHLLRSCDPAALARTARLLPGIGGKSVGEVVSQLILIWEATDADAPRISVVHALARLALRDPDTTVAAVDHLYPAGAVPKSMRTPDDAVGEPDVVRLTRRISTPLPDLLLVALVDLFACLPARHAGVVRRLCVSLLQRGDDNKGTLLKYLAGHWQEIGDAVLLDEVLRALGFPGNLPSQLLDSCGHLVAEEWARRTHELGYRLDVDQALASISPIYGQSCAAFAIGALARRTNGDQLRGVVVHLVSVHGEFAAESRTSLSQLIHAHDPAVRCLAELTADACTQLRGRALSELGRDVLGFVISSQQPSGFYPRAFGLLEADDWTAHAELASMVVSAAAHGVESAANAVKRMAVAPLAVAPELSSAVFTSLAAVSIRDDRVLEHAMWLAVASSNEDAVARLLADPSLTGKRWQRIHERLMVRAQDGTPAHLELGERLRSHILRRRGELIEWADTRAALESGDAQLRAAVLSNLWKRRENDSIDADRISYLRTLVTVDPAATVPVDRASADTTVDVTLSAARSLHYICAFRCPASPDDWSMVRTLTLYPALNPSAYVLGQSFAATCGYLESLGMQRWAGMPTMLLDLLSEVAGVPFVGLDPKVWRRELLNAVNHAVEIDGEDVVDQLLGTAIRADPDLARVLIEGLAERWFPYARDNLITLARDDASQDLRELCQELVRQHDRSVGTRSFPDLVPTLARRLRELV